MAPSPPPPSTIIPRSTGNDHRDKLIWIIIVVAVIFFLLPSLLCRRHRRANLSPTTAAPPRSRRLQMFSCHGPSGGSRNNHLAAVQANHRLWRNLRTGPFSHHARSETASMRPPRTSAWSSRDDLGEEVPPPYVPAEPERTLDRGPSMRETREVIRRDQALRRNDRTHLGANQDLRNLLHGNDPEEAGQANKPPGYDER